MCELATSVTHSRPEPTLHLPDHPPADASGVFAGTGEIGALIHQFDWSRTPLGQIETWTPILSAAVRTILRANTPMVVMWGRAGYLVYNQAYANLAGPRHPALLGSTISESMPELADFNAHVIARVFSGKSLSYKNQELMTLRSGLETQAWLNVDYSPLVGDTGEILGVLAIANETTELVRAHRRDVAELDRLRQMFELSPGFMLMATRGDLICTLANSAFLKLIGQRNLIGRSLRDSIPEADDQGFFERIENCMASGKPLAASAAKIRLRRGRLHEPEDRYVDFVFQPVFNDEGVATDIFIEGFDVTNHVRTTAALRESEARFREAANAAPVLIWLTDDTKNVVWCNKPWLEFTGRALSSEIGYGWTRGVHPADVSNTLTSYSNAFDRREEYTNTYRLLNKDGQWRHMRNVGVPRVSSDGSFVGYIGTCVDVTESRLIETELRRFNERLEAQVESRTAELAAANHQLLTQITERERAEDTLRTIQRLESIGQLTSGVAHDFNNLLTIILGNISFVERSLKQAGMTGKITERVAHVRTAADRGAKLTAQLLAFSRKQRLEARPANLNTVIANMRGLLHSSIGGSYRVTTELAPDLWTAMVDTTQIELVILNLAINGRDAMNVGGMLTIATANTTLGQPDRADLPPAGEYISVSVKDTGTGMTPDVLDRVFEPFFTTKGVGKGSGLGLPQVFGLVKQSGGGIRIDTRLGAGTTVTIYLPRSNEVDVIDTTAEIAPAAVTTTFEAGSRILLVDDDQGVREIAATLLRDAGCEVVEANSGEAALAVLNDGEIFNLLVVDFAMPGMNGVELATLAKTVDPGLPVLFVTGYADMAALEGITSDRIIQKPYREHDLVSLVAELLHKRGIAPPPS